MNRKRIKLTTLLLILFVFIIPIVVASLILVANQDADLEKGTVSSITVISGENVREADQANTIQFFIKAAKSGSPIEKAAHELEEYREVKVTFHKLNNDLTYWFYLSDSENDCLYIDPSDALYLFPADVAKEVQGHSLLAEYGLSFATFPSVRVCHNGYEYLPSLVAGEWSYIKADGSLSKDSVSHQSEEKAVLPRGEKLALQFEKEPDYCNVVLTKENGEILYSGLYAEMPTVSLDQDTPLILTVTCDWYESEEKEYSGSLKYTFDLLYDIPTLCVTDRNQALPGETVTLTISHSASEQIAVSATFAAGDITVEKREGQFVATVPVAADAKAGEFSLLVMGSDVEQTIPVTILPPA